MRADVKNRLNASKDNFINLSELDIKDSEIQEIIAIIQTHHQAVTAISLQQNNISDAGAALLGKGLAPLKDLADLNLQFNQISKKGAEALFTLLTTHPHLTISLHGNLITDTGEMAEIENAARREATLKMR